MESAMMNRREFFKTLSLLPMVNLIAKDKIVSNNFTISMNGDLDDDLIILKSKPTSTIITDIHQMHNPSGIFKYNNNIYEIEHNPGYIKFNKQFTFNEDEIYLICLANEREEANVTKRIRTHYKNEKLLVNNKEFLPPLMPEYNSVLNYPLWFKEDEKAAIEKQDINGNTYNYYNLFENTTVQFGIILPKSCNLKVYLYNQNNELMYSYDEYITNNQKNLKSNEFINNKLQEHPFTEINNILNDDSKKQIKNDDFINYVVIKYDSKIYNIPMPYPIMYPNLIFGISNK